MPRIFRIDLSHPRVKVPEVQTARAGVGKMVLGPEAVVGRLGGPAVMVRDGSCGVEMRCRECAAEVAVTDRVCSRCGAPIIGQPTVVGAVIRHLRESYKGANVAGVVLGCASALVGIYFILGSVWLYVDNRDLAVHGVRTQGQVVDADADGSDLVVYTVGGTDYEVPEPEVGDRLPGDAVTVVYDPRDPANSNLEDDSVTWHSHWFFLGFGHFYWGGPRCLSSRGSSKPTDRSAGGWRGRVPPDANRRRRPKGGRAGAAGAVCAEVRATSSLRSFGWSWADMPASLVACSPAPWPWPRLLSLSSSTPTSALLSLSSSTWTSFRLCSLPSRCVAWGSWGR